jgi:hypothetical protein
MVCMILWPGRSIPRRVESWSISITSGNVRISPELGSGRGVRTAGYIDFFIPVMKWGIEITRDGLRFASRSSRFADSDSGTYEKWLKSCDMDNYILSWLPHKHTNYCPSTYDNFFLGKPCKYWLIFFSDLPNLFHVVFGDEYREVAVYDTMSKKTTKDIAICIMRKSLVSSPSSLGSWCLIIG